MAAVLFLLAVTQVPVSAADIAADIAPPSITLNVGSGYSSSTSVDIFLRVRNDGPGDATIQSVDTPDPTSNINVALTGAPAFPTLSPGNTWSFNVRITAFTNGGSADYSGSAVVTVGSTAGSAVFTIPLTVTDWRAATLDLPASVAITHTMPCPRGFDDSQATFTVRVTNGGDYTLSVYSLQVGGIPYFVQALSSTSFTVPPNSGVDRQFRIAVPSDATERTFTGTVSASSNQNTDSGAFSFTITHPVALSMPTQTTRHDFGTVELLRPPENPWSHVVEETCGYKAGTVALDTPLPPNFVLVEPDPLRVPAGRSALLTVTPRFNSSHLNLLLLPPQEFQVKFRTNGATNPVYDFRATPSLINVQGVKDELQELSQSSTIEAGKEAARRTRELLINRTEARPPSTTTDLEDAGRIVGLGEPVILIIHQFEQMERWNAEGRQDLTVESLSVLAAGLDTLQSVCNGVVFTADRVECLSIISILETAMAAYAQEARTFFEGLAGEGLTDLGELRAAEALSLVLEALGDANGSASLRVQAEQHFANFTAHLAVAETHLGQVEERKSRLTPGGFVETQAGFVAWHPLGILFVKSFESYAEAEFERARIEVRQAGDENRLRDVDRQAAAVAADVATGEIVSWAITAAYIAAFVIAGARFSSALLRRRSDRRLVNRGEVVLGKAPPVV